MVIWILRIRWRVIQLYCKKQRSGTGKSGAAFFKLLITGKCFCQMWEDSLWRFICRTADATETLGRLLGKHAANGDVFCWRWPGRRQNTLSRRGVAVTLGCWAEDVNSQTFAIMNVLSGTWLWTGAILICCHSAVGGWRTSFYEIYPGGIDCNTWLDRAEGCSRTYLGGISLQITSLPWWWEHSVCFIGIERYEKLFVGVEEDMLTLTVDTATKRCAQLTVRDRKF